MYSNIVFRLAVNQTNKQYNVNQMMKNIFNKITYNENPKNKKLKLN